MATQQQAQQQPQPQKNRGLPWKYVRRIIYILVIITLLFFIAGGTTWVLIQVGIIKASWSDKLFTILTGLGGATAAILAIFGIFQFILSLIPSAPESPTTSPPSPSTTIQNIINVPPAPSVPPSPSPPPPTASYRGIIGLPPPTDPKTIQQRHKVVKEVYDRLTQPGITAIALTGIGGIGKSTLAALIYRYAEDQRTSGNSPFTAEPLWLTVNPAVTMADLAGTLVEALGKPSLDLGTLSPQNQAAALFNALNTVDKSRLIVMDQFENLLDPQTGQALPDRVGVGEWLDALNSQPCRCHVLLTSRPDPQGTREYPPTHLQNYHVEGLDEAEGIELLHKQDVTGTETELRTAVIHCDGHAYALTLLASLLRTRKLSLATLLKDPDFAQLWTGKVAENLLNSIYKQLDEVERKVLVAFSVYREPVPLDAAMAIMNISTEILEGQRHVFHWLRRKRDIISIEYPTASIQIALDALLAQHLLQASGEGRYQLQVIVTEYTHSHIVEGNEQANLQALQAAHARAAQYYQQLAATSCPPRKQRRQISDVHDLIEAIWQYCQAEQWQKAYDLMEEEEIFDDLFLWGGNAILLELYLLLLPDKWEPERTKAAEIYNHLGQVYYSLGQMQRARENYEEALRIYKKVKNRRVEGWMLHNLGQVYITLGQIERAREYYEQALRIHKKVKNRRGEGVTLNDLGGVYDELGKREEALTYCEQALRIHREVGNRLEEGTTLHNLGSIYRVLGQMEQAQEYYEQALHIKREIGDRRGEGVILNALGSLYDSLGDKEQALSYYQLALSIHREVENRLMEGTTLNNLGLLYNSLGNKEQALAYFQQALSINREVGDRSGEGTTLNNLGSLYDSLGNTDQALTYYQQALSISREVGDHSGEGTTLWNIGAFYFKQACYNVALACFLLARGIFEEVQSPNRDKVQGWIDDLHKKVGEKRFATLLAQVEPQAQQIVEQTLHEGSSQV